MEEELKDYSKKLQSVAYRHVTKKTTGSKKYYYTVGSSGGVVTITMKSGSTYTGHVNDNN